MKYDVNNLVIYWGFCGSGFGVGCAEIHEEVFMTEYEQLVFRKRQIDGDVEMGVYFGGEGVFTVGGGHLGKSWKTGQKSRNGKNHWSVRVAKSG